MRSCSFDWAPPVDNMHSFCVTEGLHGINLGCFVSRLAALNVLVPCCHLLLTELDCVCTGSWCIVCKECTPVVGARPLRNEWLLATLNGCSSVFRLPRLLTWRHIMLPLTAQPSSIQRKPQLAQPLSEVPCGTHWGMTKMGWYPTMP
jgi:hypothetical protein